MLLPTKEKNINNIIHTVCDIKEKHYNPLVTIKVPTHTNNIKQDSARTSKKRTRIQEIATIRTNPSNKKGSLFTQPITRKTKEPSTMCEIVTDKMP